MLRTADHDNKNFKDRKYWTSPGSDFKELSLRDDRLFAAKVSLHSESLFLFRLGSEALLLIIKQTQRAMSNNI